MKLSERLEALVREAHPYWHAAETIREAAELARRVEWQPIETAPRDGTEVIVRCYEAATEFVHIAWYRSKDEWEESGQFCGGWNSLEDWLGWWSYVRTSVSQEKLEGWHTPTHWRPLPDPPLTSPTPPAPGHEREGRDG